VLGLELLSDQKKCYSLNIILHRELLQYRNQTLSSLPTNVANKKLLGILFRTFDTERTSRTILFRFL